MKCTATTAKGKPCRGKAGASGLCAAHSGSGRKSLLDAAMADKIVRMVRAGSYKEVAARAAGIGTSTLYSWQERGEADLEARADTEHAKFVEALTRAEAEAEVHAIAAIRKVMESDWRAAMEYLARRYPKRWAKVERQEHTGRDGGPIEVSDAFRDPEVREAGRELVRRVEAARASESSRPRTGD